MLPQEAVVMVVIVIAFTKHLFWDQFRSEILGGIVTFQEDSSILFIFQDIKLSQWRNVHLPEIS